MVCTFSLWNTFAQKQISGIVTSATDGLGIPGVNVVVKGTANGTATDIDGNFTINAKPTDVLVFSSIGMKTLEVKASQTKNVVMSENTALLDEVVVIGYGTVRRRDLTGSVASIKPDEDQAKIATSLDDLLQGKAAGVNVVSGGTTPGAAGSVVIRGANSLTGDSQPLYVIDNVPQSATGQSMGNASGNYLPDADPLAGINPNDIESIQILKDASATAIYGSRGANGVILITTKRGKMGKARITAQANMTVAQAMDLLDIMNLTEYANYMSVKYPSDQHFSTNKNDILYTYKYNTESGTEESATEKIDYRNWLDESLELAFSQDYSINVNGGSEKIRYNLSSSFKDVNGILKTTGFKHGDLRLNLTADLTNKLKLRFNANGYIREGNMMSGGNTAGRASGALIPTALNSAPFLMPSNDIKLNDENRATVLSWLSDFDDITKDKKFAVAADLTYRFNDIWSYTLRAGGNYHTFDRDNWFGTELYRGDLYNGYLGQSSLKDSNYNVENLVNFNKDFDFVSINAVAGITYDAYKWLNTSLYATDFPLMVLRTNGLNTAGSVVINSPIQRDYQLMSYLGRINLSFLEGRYILTGTLRADGTSKFTKENRWAYFPSFAAAWNIGKEAFMKKADWISQLKLRLGYGETGSQNINPYTSVFLYSSGTGYADTSGNIIQGMTVNVNNPNLKWETTVSFNGGIDFGFLNDRISVTADWYNKTTKDLLLNITLPASTSFGSLTVNNGEISNTGFEFSLNANILNSEHLQWSVGGNISFNKSKIESLGVPDGEFGSIGTIKAMYGNTAGDHFGAPNLFIEGEAPGLFFGFKTDGIVQEGDTYNVEAPFSNSATPGNLKVVDTNADGVINAKDRTIIGDPNPDYTYGFQTSLKYKQFRFKAQFTGVKGGDIFNGNTRYQGLASFQNGDRNMLANTIANAWTTENTNTNYPSWESYVANGYIYDRYLEDGSYLRCSDITLGYTVPSNVLKHIGLGSLDVFASVKNAFTITDYSGFDPASRSYGYDPLRRGFDLWSYPQQRVYVLGVTLGF